jgi:hypothetical protein
MVKTAADPPPCPGIACSRRIANYGWRHACDRRAGGLERRQASEQGLGWRRAWERGGSSSLRDLARGECKEKHEKKHSLGSMLNWIPHGRHKTLTSLGGPLGWHLCFKYWAAQLIDQDGGPTDYSSPKHEKTLEVLRLDEQDTRSLYRISLCSNITLLRPTTEHAQFHTLCFFKLWHHGPFFPS